MLRQTWRIMMGVLILAGHAKAGGIAPELRKEAEEAVQKGAQWLLDQQQPQGYWSNKDFPALTALPAWTLVQAGTTNTQAIDRAVAYILSCVHDDLKKPDGSTLDWRSDLIRKLLDLRKTDPKTGAVYWVNEENRWWEADPVLVTSYTLLALQTAMKTE